MGVVDVIDIRTVLVATVRFRAIAVIPGVVGIGVHPMGLYNSEWRSRNPYGRLPIGIRRRRRIRQRRDRKASRYCLVAGKIPGADSKMVQSIGLEAAEI